MFVRLDKESVVRLYCYCYEAMRSVHRALCDPWPDFRAYYARDKRGPLRELTETLAKAAGRTEKCDEPAEWEKGFGISTWRLTLRCLLGRWLARWETSWSFPAREVCFIVGQLETLLRILESPIKPEHRVLVSLRMSLYGCQWIIAGRCHGLPEIELAHGIDHFNRTEWLPHVTLDDVLKKSA